MESFAETLNEFWQLVAGVWQTSAFGVDIGYLLTALIIFLCFWILRSLFVRTVIRLLNRLVERTETDFDDKVLDAVRDPLSMIPVVLGAFFALDYMQLTSTYDWIAASIVKSLIAYVIFWSFYRLVGPLSFLLQRAGRFLTTTVMDWAVRATKGLFIFMGVATILEVWGIQVGPLLAGLGLFGVAVALGAQDLFKNLIAGLMIIVEKRFLPGDWIKVDSIVEGTVERINFRSTMIRRFDKAPVHVPNAILSDHAVTNFSAMTHRRIYWKIGIEYRSTIDQLRKVRDRIEDYVLNNDDFAHPPEVSTFVRIDSFSDSSIDIMLYCFTRTTNWGEWLKIKEELAYKVKEIIESAGTSFAFPSQSLYVETFPEGVAEIFQPPRDRQQAMPVAE